MKRDSGPRCRVLGCRRIVEGLARQCVHCQEVTGDYSLRRVRPAPAVDYRYRPVDGDWPPELIEAVIRRAAESRPRWGCA